MVKLIEFKDVQAGDTIRFSKEVIVSRANESELYTNHGLYSKDYLRVMTSLELVDRPLPDLPNKTGSVILTKLDEATAPWMLDSTARWISPNGAAMTSVQLRAHMEKFGLTFEVIA